MRDSEAVRFLQWALPRLRMRWAGFRRVRRQVRKRVEARIRELGLDGPGAYRAYLEAHAGEWAVLDRCCRVTVSRFYRNRAVFDFLFEEALPSLARDGAVRVWCAGCASGEEPYTLALAKKRPKLDIVATDSDPHMIERARAAVYPGSSVRDLPPAWVERGFEEVDGRLRLKPLDEVSFSCEDVRETMPEGPFDLVLCRNFVFSYYDESLQREIAARMAERVAPDGALLLGHHERLPEGVAEWTVWDERQRIYRRY